MIHMKTILAALLIGLSLQVLGADMKNGEKVIKLFQGMNKDNLSQMVPEFYDSQVEFQDPVHKLKGSDQVKNYYSELYKNVEKINFDFTNVFEDKNTVIAVWKMTLETDSLKGGEPVVVEGNSVVTFNDAGKAVYHRDYFDMGEFIYENVPVLGFVVKKIKERMKNN